MASQDSPEADAARAVVRVVGGAYEVNDTGEEPGQFDVLITTAEGRSVALEVTSFGGDDWRRTRARIQAEQDRGGHASEGLEHQWLVVVPTGIGIRDLQPRLTELLIRLEREGRDWATSGYEGEDSTLQEVGTVLEELRVNSVGVWEVPPPEGQPRLIVVQSSRFIGTAGALSGALAAVFEKRDNQEKLARADCDERHLYVFLENGGAGAVLGGAWPLPGCPADPANVIDTLWVYSPSVSTYLFRVRPRTADWERFISASGEPA